MEEKMKDKFTFLGIEMDRLTTRYGFFLVGWAVFVSLITSSDSVTSWIPAFIGIPIASMGVLSSLYSARRKLWMHIAIFFGVVSLLGGLDFFRGLFHPGGPFVNPAAGASKLMLFVTGVIYCSASVRSFRWARKTLVENEGASKEIECHAPAEARDTNSSWN